MLVSVTVASALPPFPYSLSGETRWRPTPSFWSFRRDLYERQVKVLAEVTHPKGWQNLQATKALSLPPRVGQNPCPTRPPLASIWVHVGKDPQEFYIPLLSCHHHHHHPLLLHLHQPLLLFPLLPLAPRQTPLK
jgi:hypothetical protein